MSLNEDFRVKTLIYVQAYLSEQLGSWNQLCEEIQMFVVKVYAYVFKTLVQFSVYFCEHDRRDKIEKSDVKGAICYLERIKPNWAQQIIGPNEPDTFVDVSNVSSDSLDLYGKFKNMLQAVIKVVDVINPAMQFLFDHNSPLCYDDLAANMLRTKMESSLSNSFWKSPCLFSTLGMVSLGQLVNEFQPAKRANPAINFMDLLQLARTLSASPALPHYLEDTVQNTAMNAVGDDENMDDDEYMPPEDNTEEYSSTDEYSDYEMEDNELSVLWVAEELIEDEEKEGENVMQAFGDMTV